MLSLPCSCHKWMALCPALQSPALQNATRPVVLRLQNHWTRPFGIEVGQFLSSNPRNNVLPSPELLVEHLRSLEDPISCVGVPLVFHT